MGVDVTPGTCVTRGVVLLDAYDPSWWRDVTQFEGRGAIDLQDLHMRFPDRCVIGQRFGSYLPALTLIRAWLSSRWHHTPALTRVCEDVQAYGLEQDLPSNPYWCTLDQLGSVCGFTLGLGTGDVFHDWQVLTNEWDSHIRTLRATRS